MFNFKNCLKNKGGSVVLDTECTMTYRIKNTLVWILFPGTLYLVMVKRSRIE